MVLGRTYERFTIPTAYAGKLTGRSSYARMGIETACTCDLVNPGWSGHVPLELINNNRNTIRLYPFTPLVQLFVVPLSQPAVLSYEKATRSKYVNDDGGPSYWWRDDLVDAMGPWSTSQLDDAVIGRVLSEIQVMDDELVFRLDRYLSRLQTHERTNATEILSDFARLERRRKSSFQILDRTTKAAIPVLLIPILIATVFFTNRLTSLHVVIIAVVALVTVISALIQLYLWRRPPSFYDPSATT